MKSDQGIENVKSDNQDNLAALPVYLEFYKSARQEVVERLKQRDTVLVGFIAFCGVLINGSLNASGGNSGDSIVLLPVVALLVSIVYCWHDQAKDQSVSYIINEFPIQVRNATGVDDEFIGWDGGRSWKVLKKNSIVSRLMIKVSVFLIPSVFAVVSGASKLINAPWGNDVRLIPTFNLFWSLSVISLIACAGYLWRDKKIYDEFVRSNVAGSNKSAE